MWRLPAHFALTVALQTDRNLVTKRFRLIIKFALRSLSLTRARGAFSELRASAGAAGGIDRGCLGISLAVSRGRRALPYVHNRAVTFLAPEPEPGLARVPVSSADAARVCEARMTITHKPDAISPTPIRSQALPGYPVERPGSFSTRIFDMAANEHKFPSLPVDQLSKHGELSRRTAKRGPRRSVAMAVSSFARHEERSRCDVVGTEYVWTTCVQQI